MLSNDIDIGKTLLVMHIAVFSMVIQLVSQGTRKVYHIKCVQTPTWIQYRLNPQLGSVYAEGQHQYSDDIGNTAQIENNGLAPEWDCNPFSSNSIVFDQSSIASVIAALSQC